MTFDLVIRGGAVIDGTGAPQRTADVAISGDRIVEVGRVDGRGHREIDADGALVTPGFVDIHTHYDGQATWDDRLQPSSGHGVTTVVARQLRRRVRAGATDRPRDARRADGGRRGPARAPCCTRGCRGTGSRSPTTSTRSTGRHYDIDLARAGLPRAGAACT